MTSMEMLPQTRTQCSSSPAMNSMEMQIQRSSWWCHGRPRGLFDNQFQIKFTIWTEWLGPSSFPLPLALHQQWHQWRCKSKGQVDDAMGVQKDSLINNFKLNLQFEQCDSVLPPSPRSSPAMTSMEMPPQARTQCSAIQMSSWWCHGHPRGFFGNQFQIKFTIWTVWLGPSSFTSLLASDDVNGDANPKDKLMMPWASKRILW